MLKFLKKNIISVLLILLAAAFTALSVFGLINFSSPSSYYQTGELEDVEYFNSLCYEMDFEDGKYSLDSVWINFGSMDYSEETSEIVIFTSVASSESTRFYKISSFEKKSTGTDVDSAIFNTGEAVKVGDWQILCKKPSSYKTYKYFLISTENAVKINELAFVGADADGNRVKLGVNSVGAGGKSDYVGSGSQLSESGEFPQTEEAKALANKLINEQNKFEVKKADFENYTYSVSSGLTESEALTLESVRNLTAGRGEKLDLTVNPLGQYLIALGVGVFGATGFGLRIVPFLFSLLSLFAVYFTGKLLTGKPVYGLIFAFLFATGGYSLFFATLGKGDAIFAFFILCAYYSAIKFVKKGVSDKNPKKGYFNIVLGGAAFALAISVKTTAVFYLIPLIAVFAFGAVKQYEFAKSKGNANTAAYKRKAASTVLLGVVGYVFLPVIILFILFLTGYGAYVAYTGSTNVIVYGSRALWGIFKSPETVSGAENFASPIGFIINYSAQAESASKFAFGNLAVVILNLLSLVFCAAYFATRFKEKKENPLFSADGDLRIYLSLVLFALFGWLMSFTFKCGISEFYLPSVFMSGITVIALKRLAEENKKPLIGKNITLTSSCAIIAAFAVCVFFALAAPAFMGSTSKVGIFSWQVLSHTVL